MRWRALVTLAAVAVACGTAAAKQKKPRTPPLPPRVVFSPKVYDLEPRIDAVLMLTDEQREKIGKAVQETVQSPAIAALRPKKGEPVDKEKQAKLREEVQKAVADLKKRVEEVLTPEQKATVQKIDDAVKSAVDNALTKEQKEKLESIKPKKPKS